MIDIDLIKYNFLLRNKTIIFLFSDIFSTTNLTKKNLAYFFLLCHHGKEKFVK